MPVYLIGVLCYKSRSDYTISDHRVYTVPYARTLYIYDICQPVFPRRPVSRVSYRRVTLIVTARLYDADTVQWIRRYGTSRRGSPLHPADKNLSL